MTPEETQQMYRDELLAQLTTHPDKPLRLWFFKMFKTTMNTHELEFLDVKFEDDEIIVELGDK